MSQRVAMWVLGTAVGVILVIFIGALIGGLDKSSDLAAVAVAGFAAIATVVVAFFGIHVAEAGRRAAEEGRVRSEKLRFYEQGRVIRLAREPDAQKRAEILNEDPPDPYSK